MLSLKTLFIYFMCTCNGMCIKVRIELTEVVPKIKLKLSGLSTITILDWANSLVHGQWLNTKGKRHKHFKQWASERKLQTPLPLSSYSPWKGGKGAQHREAPLWHISLKFNFVLVLDSKSHWFITSGTNLPHNLYLWNVCSRVML